MRRALMTPDELDQLARGLATGPCDRDAAERAVRGVYAVAGPAPELLAAATSEAVEA